MSKSKAKKRREYLVRHGQRDPQNSRGTFALEDLRTRKTKTKREKLNQYKHKDRFYDDNHHDNRSFYVS